MSQLLISRIIKIIEQTGISLNRTQETRLRHENKRSDFDLVVIRNVVD